MDVVNGYFEAIFNEKPGKDTGWLQTFKRYKFIQIKLLESEQSETSEKKIFLTESSQVSYSININNCIMLYILQ